MGIVGVLLVGLISMIIQNLLQAGLNSLISTSKILAFAITLIYQPLVIFGLVLAINYFGNYGTWLIRKFLL